MRRGQADLVEQRVDFSCGCVGVQAAVVAQWQRDRACDRVAGVERSAAVLEHHLHVAPEQVAPAWLYDVVLNRKGVLSERLEFLTCQQCQLMYPVEDGVPNMLLEDAKPLQAGVE